MKQQFIKIWSWMTELGLNAYELLVLSIIHSYTTFKGGFDGSVSWIARWADLTAEQTQEVIDGLIEKRLVYLLRRNSGINVYKTTFLEGSAGVMAPAPKAHIINTIDSIDPIDNKSLKSISIDPIDPIDPIDNKSFKSISIDPIVSDGRPGSREGEKKNALPADAEKTKPRFTPEEIAELIAPYGCITDVPLEELSRRVRAWEERTGQQLSFGSPS